MKHLLPHDRNIFLRLTGSVYTPREVALELSTRALSLLSLPNPRILEPSVGDGSFIRAVNEINRKSTFVAVDTNPMVLDELRLSLSGDVVERTGFLNQNFLDFATADDRQGFDLIIGNPPFIKKNNFSAEVKSALAKVAADTGHPDKFLKNTWAAFLLLSARMTNPGGVLAMIVPYELLTVEYGQHALKAVSTQFDRLDVFVSTERAFKEIEQDAVAIIAQRTASEMGVFINSVQTLADLSPSASHRISISSSDNFSLELKSYLFDESTQALLREYRGRTNTIGDHCDSAPGVVTAANEFFILSKTAVSTLGATEWALPVLKRGVYLGRGAAFTSKDFEELEKREPCYLLSLPADDVQRFPPALCQYIRKGEQDGLNLRYKCRNRPMWYSVPIVPPAPALFFKRAHSFPRVCLNEANVHVTDTAYGLKPKPGYTANGLCFSFYNVLTMLFAEIDGRFYGGGVLELSPKEFRGLPIPYHEPTQSELAAFKHVHLSSQGNIESILDFGDTWLAVEKGFSRNQLSALRQAWRASREHRLRHGSTRSTAKA